MAQSQQRWHISILALLFLSGCATTAPGTLAPPKQAIPILRGSYHNVRPGETLWRIARLYGLDARTLASANRLPSTRELNVGQRLFIPLPRESSQFLWPVLGSPRASANATGVEIAAPAGSLVRASRSGRVAVATLNLSGWGKTIVLDHLDGYLSIYSGLDQILVAPGVDLRQGTPLGSLGSRVLHFEIRYGSNPRNTLALLPPEL